jgi:transposase
MVCVQPMLVARAREAEDYTGSKSGYGDAVIIARLVAELRCYIRYLPQGLGAAAAPGNAPGAAAGPGHCGPPVPAGLLECGWPSILGRPRSQPNR